MKNELIIRAKNVLISDYIEEEEMIYLGFLLNKYIDNSDAETENHLSEVCGYIENRSVINRHVK